MYNYNSGYNKFVLTNLSHQNSERNLNTILRDNEYHIVINNSRLRQMRSCVSPLSFFYFPRDHVSSISVNVSTERFALSLECLLFTVLPWGTLNSGADVLSHLESFILCFFYILK